MATYAVGDVHGCHDTLRRLVERFGFDAATDRLWFVGDLVNRGPTSAEVLRYVRGLGSSAITVLGNHDLHLLAVHRGVRSLKAKDDFTDVLGAPDREELCAWLLTQPLIHREDPYILVHAGLAPAWSAETAETLAREVEAELRGDHPERALAAMYEESPEAWTDDARGIERVRLVLKFMTRLRVCQENGAMVDAFVGPPEQTPAGVMPWFRVPNRATAEQTVVFGHWAALGFRRAPGVVALDSGCGWGRELTAVRLDDREVFRQARLEDCADPAG